MLFHVTWMKHFDGIMANGLIPRYDPNAQHSGYGIYLFAEGYKSHTMAEWLGFHFKRERYITIQVDLALTDPDMRIDEDAVTESPDSTRITRGFARYYDPAIVRAMQEAITSSNDYASLQAAKIKVIDNYKIMPHPKVRVYMGHYDFMTCRYPSAIGLDRIHTIWYDHERLIKLWTRRDGLNNDAVIKSIADRLG